MLIPYGDFLSMDRLADPSSTPFSTQFEWHLSILTGFENEPVLSFVNLK